MLLAALSAVTLAGTAGAVEGWRHSPDGVGGYWTTTATEMPPGPPVYVRPECPLPAIAVGPLPRSFKPVRAIGCGMGPSGPGTGDQTELTDPKALSALVDAYRTAHIRVYITPEMACTLELDNDFPIVFEDAHGTGVLAGSPRDTCYHLLPAVVRAVAEAPWAGASTAPAH
jgi:hypothetical protein